MGTQFLQLNDGQIGYDDQGSGPLVICAHSMGDLRGEYRFLTPQLTAAGYRVVTMDVRGHGESSPNWADVSVGAIGSDLLALARRLNAGPALIVGTSMAAGAAVWAAAEGPDLVRGLALIGPFVRGNGSALGSMLYSALFARPWGPALWQMYYTSLYPTRKPADFATYRAALRANLAEPGRIEALRNMLTASKTASEARLGQVKAPVWVVMGSKDPDFKNPAAEAEWTAAALRGSYTMVEGAGHYPHAEMPEVTGPIILSFFEQIRNR
jgi:pimeloyl-ACP methyl ester carboxylesterase